MSKHTVRTPLGIALTATVAMLGTTGLANAEQAEGSLFTSVDLGNGYLLAGAHGKDKDKDKDKSGEGKCGEDKGGEGKCGEGKCGSA